MPRSGGDAPPCEYVAHGGWPSGSLVPDAPASARYAQVFVQRLGGALTTMGLSLRAVEREAGVNRLTVDRVLAGQVLPDFGAIARLEEWLGLDLWPGPEMRAQKDQRATRDKNVDQSERQS